MRHSDAYYPKIKIELRRKEPDPRPEHACTFICSACDSELETHELSWNEWRENHVPPICFQCALYWNRGRSQWVDGISGGDYRTLGRLAAMINVIEWEAVHGRRIRAVG